MTEHICGSSVAGIALAERFTAAKRKIFDRIYEKLDDAEAGGASGDFAAGRWQTDRSLSG